MQDVFQFFVPENLKTKSEIATVKAVDKDDGPNGEVHYRIVGNVNMFLRCLIYT